MPARRPSARKTATVADLGEFELIDRIARRVAGAGGSRAPRATRGGGVVLGIGDDAALLRARAGEDVAVSVDTAVEGVHFDWRVDHARSVGRRALAAALSDLAAMGARPLGCTLALSVDPALELRRLDASLRGFIDEAEERSCPLVGGNLARAGETSFAATVVGAVARGRALRRDAARPGDAIFATGMLGGSALARATAACSGAAANRFVAPDRLSVGRALARLPALSHRPACIDLSDGLAADLPHLLEASARAAGRAKAFGAEIETERLPRARGFERRCNRVGLDPVAALVAGGEDYELLFTASGRWAREEQDESLSARLGAPVARIGTVSSEPGIRGLGAAYRGFRHF